MILLEFFLAHWTGTYPFKPLKDALLVEHVFTWKFSYLLIFLELNITYRAQIWFRIFFLVFYLVQMIQFLLIQTGILVGIGPSCQHINKLDECGRVGAVGTDEKVGASIGWKSDNLISGPVSVLMLILKGTATKKRMSKKIHQRTRAVHISISLVKYHRHTVLIIWIKRLFMSSHSISSSLIYLDVERIFLANLPVVIHQRARILTLTETALDFPVFALSRMRIKLGKGLPVSAKDTGDFILVLEFRRGFL